MCSKYRLMAAALILLITAAATSAGSDTTLPAAWDGVWKGMTVIDSGTPKPQQVPMELHVAAVADSSVKTWKILYGAGDGQSTRNYEIAPVPNEPGRFLVDEKNGLLLDNYLLGNVLLSQFTVSGNFVSTRFELRGDIIEVEMTIYDAKTPRQSKLTGAAIEVNSYRWKSTQHGTLTRSKPANDKNPK
jgi:hypothetical protein